MTPQREDRLQTPLGELILRVDSTGALAAAGFAVGHPALARSLEHPAVAERDPGGITSQVAAWFAGDLEALDGIRVDISGSGLECAVWLALRAIPVGETRTYTQLAARLGRPKAVRAVAAAVAANPNSVVVPCHRVVGEHGIAVAYPAGPERKEWLLAHERAQLSLPVGPRR